ISGTIGSGKTQAILALLEQIRAAGDRAIVFDLTGGFLAPFYREGTDIILNPLDARSPSWSVFCEADSKAAFDAIAAAMIPRGQKADPVWADSARMVFSTAAQLLIGDGKATNQHLVDTLLNANLEDLAPFFEGTPAATIVSSDTPKMTNSVRMMLSTYLDCLRLLPSEGQPFSITEWMTDDQAEGTVYLSSRADMHVTLKPLLTVWMDTAVRALMSQPRDPKRRIWFIIDELPSLQQLPSIMDGLARGRQFGAAFVLGIQAQSQLREIYGPDGAQSLSSVCRSKLILAASDADTAKWYADFLGRQERSQSNENVSFGANTIRDGVMVARQDKIEHLVIPEEIMNLRSLEGFLKMPEGFPLAKVKVPLTIRDQKVPAFVPRGDQSLLIRRSGTAANEAEATPTRSAFTSTPTAGTKRSDDDQRDIFEEAGPPEGDALDALFDSEPVRPSSALAGSGKESDEPSGWKTPRRELAFPDWDMEP
ncbi:MAG: type IV secretion system DNA-binding domain-containing protein, partial [Pseudomonadota bacterium]